MITLRKLNKYYNKRHSNELHVLKDISLSFEDKGFVALVGKSGSGKTTLLNCLGGLDGFDSGKYLFDGNAKDGKPSSLAAFRRKNIGFVFQNYSLIEDMTVEDNILSALNIAEQTVNVEKVNVALAAVNMARYNKRRVNTLSGGQKQRVAIARALSINPRVMLADEPTGNLDKANSIQIMQLLKAISAEMLVILVSHERELVNRFADRVIEIDNAQIVSDNPNLTGNDQAATAANKPTVVSPTAVTKDSFVSHGIKINLYYKNEKPASAISQIDIVIDGEKATVGGDASFVISPEITYSEEPAEPKADVSDDFLYAISNDAIPKVQIREQLAGCNRSTKATKIRIGGLLTTKLQKISAVVMILTAIMIALSVSLINGATKISAENFQESANNAVSLTLRADNDMQKIYDIKQNPLIEYLAPYQSPFQLKYTNRGLFQTNHVENEDLNLLVKPLPMSLIGQDDVFYGKLPSNSFEAVIDKFFIDCLFAKSEGVFGRGAVFGITSVKGFLGGEFYLTDEISVKITGISDTGAPTVFMSEDLILSLTLQATTATDKLLLSEKQGDFILSDITFASNDEIYVSKETFDEAGFVEGEENHLTVNGKQYIVKGGYETIGDSELDAYIVSSSELERIAYGKLAASQYAEALIKGNVEVALQRLGEQGINARSLVEAECERYLGAQRAQMTLQLVFTVVIGLAAILFCYFSVKAMIVEKKKELAVKVALGIKRTRIYTEFLLSALILFAVFSLPAYLITGAIIGNVLSKAQGLFSMMSFSVSNFAVGFLILLAIPISVTSIALIKYIYKKPIALLRE